MFKNIKQKIASHKIISFIIIIVLVASGYYSYQKFNGSTAVTSYVLSTVEKGTLITTISGSGQISASNQVDVKAKTSGDVISVAVKAGQEVKSGALLAQISATDALKAVRDAQTSLETAKLELEQTMEPTDELTLLQAENSLIQNKETKQEAIENLADSYEDGFNAVANVFLELPDIMTGLNDVLFSYGFNSSQINIDYYTDVIKNYNENGVVYRNDAYDKYQIARAAYEENFENYKSTSRFSDTVVIGKLVTETYESTKDISEAIKSANNLIRLYQDIMLERNLRSQALSDTHLSSLSSYTSKINSYLTSLLSAKNSTETARKTIESSERSIQEKELSIAKLKNNVDDLTVRAKKIAIQQKEDTLTSARQTLADCSARAPFDGVVAEVGVKKGDSVTSGSAIATIITKQKIAEISLNEVDVAKVKIGQKVNLTFDAIEDLNISGSVAEVDTLGTASSGVVSYTVQIAFDTQDDRVKPGMSVTAVIILEAKTDVLLLPTAAIKSVGDNSYIEVVVNDGSFDTTVAKSTGVTLITTPTRQTVTVGSSDDTNTEITSGVKEGDLVVVRTVGSTAKKATANSGATTNKTTNTSGSIRAIEGVGGGGPPGGF